MKQPKPHVGHHLMRVRITKSMFHKLQDVADEMSDETNAHVTVSDLVRAAIYNYLLVTESVRQLENLPPAEIESEELVTVYTNPMLSFGG